MKLISVYVSIVLTFSASTVFGSPVITYSGVRFFEGSFENALEQAKQEELPVFVYLTIPNCSPCEFMETEVFPDSSVGDYMNARFVSFKLDAFDEESNGPAIAKRFSVVSYPTYLIVGHDGKVKHRSTSASNPKNFMRMIGWLTGETASPMAEHDAKYAKGDRDPDFVQQYLLDSRLAISLLPKDLANWEANMQAYQQAQDKYTSITKEYLASKPPEDLMNSRDLSIITAYCQSLDDAGINLVMDNFDAYIKAASMEQVCGTLLEVAYYTALSRALEGDPTYLHAIEMLEEEPLKRATDWEQNIDPESRRLPESLREQFGEIFSDMKESASLESED